MGKNRRHRKRPWIKINTSVTELPDATSIDKMDQRIAMRRTTTRPNFARPNLLPVQVHPFSDMPSSFSRNAVSRKGLSPIPFWHADFAFPQLPTSVPVAVVTPLPGVQVGVSAENARPGLLPHPIPSTLPASDSMKSSGTQTLAEDFGPKLSVASSERNQSTSTHVSELAVEVVSCETKIVDTVNVSSATDPVTVLSHQVTNSSVNDEGLSSAENEVDEVIFLYRVEPEEGKLIEVVDLSEDTNEISSNRNFLLSSRNPSSSKETEMKQGIDKSSPDSQEVLEIHSSISILEKSKGPGELTHAGTKRKREDDFNTHCRVCHRNDGVCKDGNLLFISKCGHMFCVTCLRNLVPYKCTECNAGISNLCKVVI